MYIIVQTIRISLLSPDVTWFIISRENLEVLLNSKQILFTKSAFITAKFNCKNKYIASIEYIIFKIKLQTMRSYREK